MLTRHQIYGRDGPEVFREFMSVIIRKIFFGYEFWNIFRVVNYFPKNSDKNTINTRNYNKLVYWFSHIVTQQENHVLILYLHQLFGGVTFHCLWKLSSVSSKWVSLIHYSYTLVPENREFLWTRTCIGNLARVNSERSQESITGEVIPCLLELISHNLYHLVVVGSLFLQNVDGYHPTTYFHRNAARFYVVLE